MKNVQRLFQYDTELFSIIRELMGITVKEFADKLGCSINTMYNNCVWSDKIPYKFYWRLREIVPDEVMNEALMRYSEYQNAKFEEQEGLSDTAPNADAPFMVSKETLLQALLQYPASNVLKEEAIEILENVLFTMEQDSKIK